ncbi:hypothetical protein BHM03_00055439 [Ensete ventricosum]|nr:hypothetical protein BHM03_00055439 [Ensete ventricosum]
MPATTASASPSPPTIASPLPSPSVASSSVGHHSSSPLLHHRQPSLPSPTIAAATLLPQPSPLPSLSSLLPLPRLHPRSTTTACSRTTASPLLATLPYCRCFPVASSALLLPPSPSSSPSAYSSAASASCCRSTSEPMSLLSPSPSAAYSPTPPVRTHASATQPLPPLHQLQSHPPLQQPHPSCHLPPHAAAIYRNHLHPVAAT